MPPVVEFDRNKFKMVAGLPPPNKPLGAWTLKTTPNEVLKLRDSLSGPHWTAAMMDRPLVQIGVDKSGDPVCSAS